MLEESQREIITLQDLMRRSKSDLMRIPYLDLGKTAVLEFFDFPAR
jgi:hypothetical protein